MIRGGGQGVIRVRRDAKLGFATGELSPHSVGYTDLIARVRGIADEAATLIDEAD
jgi:hypothetical protein